MSFGIAVARDDHLMGVKTTTSICSKTIASYQPKPSPRRTVARLFRFFLGGSSRTSVEAACKQVPVIFSGFCTRTRYQALMLTASALNAVDNFPVSYRHLGLQRERLLKGSFLLVLLKLLLSYPCFCKTRSGIFSSSVLEL